MKENTILFKLFTFLVGFVFLSFVLQEHALAENCDYPMGLPGEACCMKDDPFTSCCATLDMCSLAEDLCICNEGNRCALTGGGMFYRACVADDIECGEKVGQPCCEEPGPNGTIWVCNHPNDIACNYYTQKCESCGSEGQICCNNSTKCDSGLNCGTDGICKNFGNEPETDCNETNEMCCYDGWGVGKGNTCQIIDTVPPVYDNCYCKAGLTCTKRGTTGYCTDAGSCGGMDEICCDPPLQRCDDGLTCSVNLKICGHYDDNLPPGPPGLVYTGPIIDSLEKIIGPVAKMLYYGGLAIGVLFIILSGYKIMVSEGDPQRVKAAQEQLTSAILGIIFILLSVTIIRIIMNTIVNI